MFGPFFELFSMIVDGETSWVKQCFATLFSDPFAIYV